MTTELTQPQSEPGPAQAAGPGQSQGHRRRRRRRKNKTSQQGAPQAQQPQTQQPPAQPAQAPALAAPAMQHAQPVARHKANQGHSNHQNQRQTQKKKFFQKGSPNGPQPGNSISSPMTQGRRKTKQKGPREFVGPMDHSYRTANGNVADGPQSTIPVNGNGRGGYYQEDFAPAAPIPVREDAPARIFCFIEDLFFLAKIQETARKLGVKVEFVKGNKESIAKLTDLPEEERPKLIVFDLNNLSAKPMSLIPKLKTKFKKATSIVGFLNHLQGELKAKAVEVGCDTVMPRSAFSQSLPNLLRRYGVEEEDDYSQQPA